MGGAFVHILISCVRTYVHVGTSQSERGSEDIQPATLPFIHSCPVSTCAGPKGDHVKFPIDFFEHCVPLTSGDVDVSVRQGSSPQCYCILGVVMLSISVAQYMVIKQCFNHEGLCQERNSRIVQI